MYANNGGHFKIVSIKKKKINIVNIKPYNLKKIVQILRFQNIATHKSV